MSKTRAVAFVCICGLSATIAWAGDRPSIEYERLETGSPVSLSLRAVSIPSTDPGYRGSGWEIRSKGDLLDASLDPDRGRLLVVSRDSASKSKTARLLTSVDLRDGSVRWEARCTAKDIRLSTDHVVAHSDDSLLIIDSDHGRARWGHGDVETSLGPMKTSTASRLIATVKRRIPGESGRRGGTDHFYPPRELKHEMCGLDAATGRVDWTTPIPFEGLPDWLVHDSERLFFAGSGVGALRLTDGVSWSVPATTRSSSDGLAAAVTIASLVGAAAMGGPWILMPSTGAHHLGSAPMLDGDDVYFSGGKGLMRVRSASGEIVWKQELDSEPGCTRIFDLGSRILLLGSGWKLVGPRIEPAKRAVAAIYEKESGAVAAVQSREPVVERVALQHGRHEKIREPETYLDAAMWDRGLLLLTPSTVQIRDDSLAPVGEIRNEAYGSFLHFVPTAPGGLVRTTRGVLALAMDGTVRWWRELKPALFRHKDKPLELEKAFEKNMPFVSAQGTAVDPKISWREMAWIAWTDQIYSQGAVAGAYYATPSGTGFVALDARTGAVVGSFETPDPVQVDAIGPGYLSLSAPRQMTVVRLSGDER